MHGDFEEGKGNKFVPSSILLSPYIFINFSLYFCYLICPHFFFIRLNRPFNTLNSPLYSVLNIHFLLQSLCIPCDLLNYCTECLQYNMTYLLLLSLYGMCTHFPVSPLNFHPWNGHSIQSPLIWPPTAMLAPMCGQYASMIWARLSSPRKTARFIPLNKNVW